MGWDAYMGLDQGKWLQAYGAHGEDYRKANNFQSIHAQYSLVSLVFINLQEIIKIYLFA